MSCRTQALLILVVSPAVVQLLEENEPHLLVETPGLNEATRGVEPYPLVACRSGELLCVQVQSPTDTMPACGRPHVESLGRAGATFLGPAREGADNLSIQLGSPEGLMRKQARERGREWKVKLRQHLADERRNGLEIVLREIANDAHST